MAFATIARSIPASVFRPRPTGARCFGLSHYTTEKAEQVAEKAFRAEKAGELADYVASRPSRFGSEQVISTALDLARDSENRMKDAIREVKVDLKAEIKEVKDGLTTEIKEVKDDLITEIKASEGRSTVAIKEVKAEMIASEGRLMAHIATATKSAEEATKASEGILMAHITTATKSAEKIDSFIGDGKTWMLRGGAALGLSSFSYMVGKGYIDAAHIQDLIQYMSGKNLASDQADSMR